MGVAKAQTLRRLGGQSAEEPLHSVAGERKRHKGVHWEERQLSERDQTAWRHGKTAEENGDIREPPRANVLGQASQ